MYEIRITIRIQKPDSDRWKEIVNSIKGTTKALAKRHGFTMEFKAVETDTERRLA